MKVPVSRPTLGDAEIANVNRAMLANAVSGLYGEYLERFESEFAAFCDTRYAVSCASGTAALHLAMAAAGVKAGDEVLVSTLTNMATFFSVLYLGAKPVPVDIDLDTLTMCPNDLARKVTKKSRAIMVVHLFGHPTDMDAVNAIAEKHGLLVFEDCAEAHGALYKGQKVGGLSHAGAFSFFANKIIMTGEGGMVTTNDQALADKARSLRSLAFGVGNKFMHQDVGFNYRMTNLQAAIGCGQMTRAAALVEKRRTVSQSYINRLAGLQEFLTLPKEMPWAKSVYWMFHIVLKERFASQRDAITKALAAEGVETREGFVPYNLQTTFIERGWVNADACPNANSVAFSSFYLPSGPDISEDELDYVSAKTIEVITKITSA